MTWLSATIPSLLAVRPTRRAHVRGLLPLLALVALGLLACNGDSRGPDAADAATPVEYDLVETTGECNPAGDGDSCELVPTDNSLIVNVSGEWSSDEPVATVAVEYWAEDGDPLRTPPASLADGTYEVTVARLRPESAYEFRVIGLDAAGVEVAGPTGTFETGSLPPGLHRATFEVLEGAPTQDLTFMDFNPNEFEGEATFHGMIAIDGAGHVVWYAETGETSAIARRENGNLVFVDYTFGLREVTPTGEEVANLPSECVPIVYHHEVELMPDGTVLTMGFDVRDTFGDEERLQVGDTIVHWDPWTGASEELWSIHDVEDPAVNRTEASGMTEGFMWTGCDENLPTEDWSHGNSVQIAPDGSVLVSSRHLNQVHSLSSDFEEVNWRLGGEGSDFAFPDASDQFYHQHSAIQLENGNVLLFDNGNTRPEEEGGEYSRALELELDMETMTASKVWEYQPEPPIFSPCCANVERLENGNTLMIFPGDIFDGEPCCRPQTIVEAGAAGETVWKLEARATGLEVVYRVYAADSILGEAPVEAAAGG